MEEENDSIIKEEIKQEKKSNNDFFENKKILKNNNNRRENNNKIIIIILAIVVVLLTAFVIYTLLIKDRNTITTSKEKNEDGTKENIIIEEENDNTGYVMCDTNTSSLNVRNSIDGDIIDSLSCFKEVIIEEIAGESENCKKWYKIGYTKKGSNYTGYACGTYIKDVTTKSSTIKAVKEVIEKANNYYEKVLLLPWCGKTSDSKKITIEDKREGKESIWDLQGQNQAAQFGYESCRC